MAAASATAPQRRPSGRPTPRSAPRRAPLRVVGPAPRLARRLPRPRRLHLWASVGLIAGSLILVVVGDAMVTQSSIRLSRIEHQVAAAEDTQKSLATAVAQMESPGSIINAAKGMGLTVASSRVFLPSVPPNVRLPEPDMSTSEAPATPVSPPSPSSAGAAAPGGGATSSAAPGPATTAPPSSGAGAAVTPSPAAAPATGR